MKKKRPMRRVAAVILAALMLTAAFPGLYLGASAAEDPAAQEAAVTPVIALDYVPAYGVNSPVTGTVFTEDGSAFTPEDYRISVFLKIYEGGEYWRKPYNDHPYTELGDDGSFSAVFNTGGEDINARILHILLVPSDYTPVSFPDTERIALDHVTVVRTEGGDITINPQRAAPPPGDVQPAINALLPVSEDKIAVDVGFYTDGSEPGSPLSEALIRQQLEAVSVFSDTVRFYKAGGEEYKAYRIAHEMGFNVVGTAYLCGNEAEDKEEMNALIEHCNNGLVDVAVVGNETLLDTGNGPKLTARQLVRDIQYVRAGLTDSSIPVSTSDSVDVLLANSSVRNACNLIMPNCYPFWGKTHIDNAAAAFMNSINALKAVSGGKQVLISETGWPTDGGTNGSAVPNEENAAQFFEQIREWSLSTGTQVLYFDAADEPWKAGPNGEGDVGSHWGFMTTGFELKDGYAGLSFFDRGGSDVQSIENAEITGIADKTYTGSAVTQQLTVKIGSVMLRSGTDYTVSYSSNVNVGEASVTVTGKGEYEGTVTKKFLILPGTTSKVTARNVKTGIKLSWEKVAGATHYRIYRGSKLLVTTSKLEMTDQEVVDSIGKKYTYKVYATANKTWDSPKARSAAMYRLRPVGITSATSTNPGKMTVKYDYGEVCTGYVVRYGLKSDMSDAKVITVSGAGTTTRTFSGLTKGKTYYVQARTYILENGTRYYSAYSLTKSVKIIK